MERYVCIHAHFYQPPRENAWLETVELQDEAYPYHDWNERITAECYALNSASRILDKEGRITRITNNYANISFNFGPTLLAWIERHSPEVYEGLLQADKDSQDKFSGHGSALAQAYNHMILPLANRLDKYTQIHWGIKDFERRFARKPEGMWLPETAVDLETLDLLSEFGLAFTILAPRQAHSIRALPEGKWTDVAESGIDPSRAYQISLPSGRKMSLFFYDGPISQAVAFERLLNDGETFALRLTGGFSDKRTWPQMVHIATDGETYGHHHRFGDMALAYALDYIESRGLARLTNYGAFLEKHPPSHEVRIHENTSWSCVHGLERWRADCRCHSGRHREWNQAWRQPLRVALDWLRDALAPLFETQATNLVKDPWAARNDYISLILDRSDESRRAFLSTHALRELNEGEAATLLRLLELQRHAMLMYTSCGWFFDDISGIETVQVLQYAGRAIQIATETFKQDLEPQFLQMLQEARSNVPEYGDGRRIYTEWIKPAMVDLNTVGAHYAVSSLFEDYEEQAEIYCYQAQREDYRLREAGRARLALGRVRITSDITRESATKSFGVLHFGDHNINCGVREYHAEETYQALIQEISEAFDRADFPTTLRLLDKHFGTSSFSLKSLFRDEQRKILHQILEATLAEAESVYGRLYQDHASLMRFLKDLGTPPPRALAAAADLVLNANLRLLLEAEELQPSAVAEHLQRAKSEGVQFDTETLEYAFRQTMEALADRFAESPTEPGVIEQMTAGLEIMDLLPFRVKPWKIQNISYRILHTIYPQLHSKAEGGEGEAQIWVVRFRTLAEKLRLRLA